MFNPDKSKAMFDAIDRRNVPELKRLLDDPEVDVNSINRRGRTAFALACMCDKPEVVRCFLDSSRQIDYNHVSECGLSAIHYVESPSIMRLLCNDPRIDVNRLANNHGLDLYVDCEPNCTKEVLACERFTAVIDLKIRFCDKRTSIDAFRHRLASVDILKAYIANPAATKARLRLELGWPDYLAAELFATIVLVCDDYYEIKEEE